MEKLSGKEIEVLKLVVKGLGNKQIASMLLITPSTVKSHISSIMRKLEAPNRTALLCIAIENNIIEI